MALLMLNTLQTTRLLNVFHTENYTKTWNVKWCPLTSVQMEIQHHSRSKADDFTSASCETDSMAKADVWNQALNQHPLGAGPPPGVPAESTWLPGLPGERDTSLCPAWHWRPGHAREAAQRWSTHSVPVCCGVLWPGLARKTEQTGKLQTTSAIQTNRWKAARAKLGVIKKRHWLRCKCSFCKQNPALQICLEFFKLLWSKGRERSKWWIHVEFHNEVCKRLPKKLQLTQRKKKKDPHPVEPTWT